MSTADPVVAKRQNMVQGLLACFRQAFDESVDPASLTAVRAPGRVNLIGEHTDYNGGYVLPVAIDREIVILGRPTSGKLVRAYSADFDELVEFEAGADEHDQEKTWSNYLRGVLLLLCQKSGKCRGMEIVFSGDVPRGSGLSSSAALEIATAEFARLIWNADNVEPLEIIKLAQRAENEFVGVNCGIMDQFVSRMGRKGHALFLDCLTHEYQLVPLPEQYSIIISDTGVKHSLVDSAYNERRSQCERGVELLSRYLPGIQYLREVSVEQFDRYASELPELMAQRCRHVVGENQRVLDSVQALRSGDYGRFGALMYASHESLRDLYEVSCPELDVLVEIARAQPGVLGSRMTGAGFGGCTVTLVETDQAPAFVANVKKAYKAKTGLDAIIYTTSAEDGAGPLQVTR